MGRRWKESLGRVSSDRLILMSATLAEGAFIWDAHAGFELRCINDLKILQTWKNAGINFVSINVGYDVNEWHKTIENLSYARDWVSKTKGYRLAGTVKEIDEAVADADMAVAFDIEGAKALNDSIEMVRIYYDLGVRQMLFAYNINNAAGGGCHDEDSGLTAFGRSVVSEMNDVGMMVDCSHCGYRTTLEIMENSRDPVVFSHSNARKLWDHERNICDEQAIRCANTGGVVGVNGISQFTGDREVKISSMVAHIEYYLTLIGDEHVGIGLDYFQQSDAGSGFEETVSGNTRYWPKHQYQTEGLRCVDPPQIIKIGEELLRRNYQETTVEKILGGNFRRVAEQVWK